MVLKCYIESMNKKTRRIIFYIFLFVFLIMVPVIIFYALGYNFDFEEKTIISTGAIYIKSYPTKAEIYINDKLRGKTNKLVGKLIPKTYNIQIIKKDFYPWQKEIIIKEGIVTKVDNIFLVPFNPKIFLVATESEKHAVFFKEPYSITKITELIKKKSKYTVININNLNFDYGQNKLYFLSKNNLYSIKLNLNDLEDSILSDILVSNVLNYTRYKNGIIYLDYFTRKIFELDLTSLKSAEFFNQVFPGFDKGKWIISNDNKKLLCQKEKSVEILWLDEVKDSIFWEKGNIEKINFGENINDVIWHPKTDEHLIIATNDSILITELDNRPPRNTINFITTEKPEIKYDYSNKTLYFLSQDRLYQTEL